MKQLKDNNGYIIYGWMRSVLDLSETKLELYAIIYSFSQDGESVFKGSLTYLEEWVGKSRPFVIKCLKELCECKLIIRSEKIINNQIFPRYKANLELLRNKISELGGSKQCLPVVNESMGDSKHDLLGSKQCLPHINNDNKCNTLSNNELLSNDITYNKESRNPDLDEPNTFSLPTNSVKITDSAEEINKIKNSTICQSVEEEKNDINPHNPPYSSSQEKLENNEVEKEDDFDDLFNAQFGTDRKSRLAQTNNSNGTLAKELFDYWNSKKLRVHRAFQQHYLERFTKLMQSYSIEQIKHIIDNYEKLVHDKTYYWTYIWDLQDFIDPREQRFLRFADDGQEWLNFKQGSKGQQAFRRTAFHNEEYNQALREGKDIGALDDMHAEEVRKLRRSPNVIKL